MKKTFLALVSLGLFLSGHSLDAQITSFSSLKTAVVATSPGNKLSGSPTNFAQLTWQVSGTISTCDVEIDSSTDGVTWSAGGLISNQVCTSAGSSTVVSTTVNYVRVNVSTLTGGGTITANFIGYATNSGGTISSITSTGSTLTVTGGSGPTTNLDLNLAHANIFTANQTAPVYTATTGMVAADGTVSTGGYGFSTLTTARIYTNAVNTLELTADNSHFVSITGGGSGSGLSSNYLGATGNGVSAPAFAENNHSSNGFYFPSSTSLGMACGGTNCGTFTTTLVTLPALAVAVARKGTFVCTAAGTITISNTNELITSDVVISLNTVGGTITTPPAMKTTTSGTGFTVLCGASDTSTYNYDILN